MTAQQVSITSYSSLADAVSAVSSTGGEIDIPAGDYAIGDSLTIPANIGLRLHNGALLIAANTSLVLTIIGPFDASRSKVFSGFGSGKVVFHNTQMVIPEWWGVRDGNGRDDIAINEAIIAGKNIGLMGDYHCGERILLPHGGVNGYRKSLVGLCGKASLYASTANKTLLHLADSYTTIRDLSLWADAQGIVLFRVTPELEENNTAVVNQNWNLVDNVDLNGGDDGLILMAGRQIGGAASGCWYNRFTNMRWSSNKRALLLRDNGSTNIISSGSNSNYFEGTMCGSINTGIQIAAGGGNEFHIQMENIILGTSPSNPPTGIIVADAMANGGDNPNNVFHDWHGENITRHAQIDEKTTKFFNSDLNHSLVVGTAKDLFLDDGKARTKSVTVSPTLGGGTITLDSTLSKLSWSEKQGVVTVTGYIHVASVSGTLQEHLLVSANLPPPLPGTAHRAAGAAAVNELVSNAPLTGYQCRILEGDLNPNGSFEIMGMNGASIAWLAPYVKAGTNIQLSLVYQVR